MRRPKRGNAGSLAEAEPGASGQANTCDVAFRFPVFAHPDRVFEAIATPKGLDEWWTLSCEGEPGLGAHYVMDFGPGYRWLAEVSRYLQGSRFAVKFTQAAVDWMGTEVDFELTPKEDHTIVEFRHSGWAGSSDHFRTSSFCWAMYLRIMKRNVEFGEKVGYSERLEV